MFLNWSSLIGCSLSGHPGPRRGVVPRFQYTQQTLIPSFLPGVRMLSVPLVEKAEHVPPDICTNILQELDQKEIISSRQRLQKHSITIFFPRRILVLIMLWLDQSPRKRQRKSDGS